MATHGGGKARTGLKSDGATTIQGLKAWVEFEDDDLSGATSRALMLLPPPERGAFL